MPSFQAYYYQLLFEFLKQGHKFYQLKVLNLNLKIYKFINNLNFANY